MSIAEDLANILSSRYGRDVRQSIHDSIDDIWTIAKNALTQSEDYAEDTKEFVANKASIATEKAEAAAASATLASDKASQSAASATDSANKASASASSAALSLQYKNQALSSSNSAKDYYERTVAISNTSASPLKAKGTIYFANLPTGSSATANDMYCIIDSFTTRSDFVMGAGTEYEAGSIVYLLSTKKWDVLDPTSDLEMLVTIDEFEAM